MTSKKQKLELTWIGKENRAKLEPRILLEEPERSYHAAQRVSDADIYDNLLIHGDNLLALKALEQDYAGKVKCIYIDPPYNTGYAFELYDDGIEHSLWLGLMRDRLEILRNLLQQDGVISVQIGYDEMAYLKILMDEIFGRNNCIGQVAVRMSHSAGMKRQAKDRRLIKNTEYILIYFKNSQPTLQPLFEECFDYPVNYYQYIIKHPKIGSPGQFIPLSSIIEKEFKDSLEKLGIKKATNKIAHKLFLIDERFREFVIKHKSSIGRKDSNVPAGINIPNDLNENEFIIHQSEERDYYVGKSKDNTHWQLYSLEEKVQRVSSANDDGEITSREVIANLLGDWWDGFWRDMSRVDIEGGVQMKESKKPERLIEWILRLITKPGDLVLDSFLGSGTTAAVAHKMGRRWIGIELGEHCHTHCLPRLKKVIDGADPGGITEAVGWKGGGGFRYYRLAPSLLQQDKWGNWIISQDYNAPMLAEAICKLEGFTYAPSDKIYWQHGRSTEQDFLYVTTASLNYDQLQQLSDEVGSERSLLVVCTSFRGRKEGYPNLTVKKIPKAVLTRCEWGHDDYSLKVENLPAAPKPAPEPGQIDLL